MAPRHAARGHDCQSHKAPAPPRSRDRRRRRRLCGRCKWTGTGRHVHRRPERVVQGNPATFSVVVSPAGARCSLSVRYKSRARQKGLKTVTAAGGTATWTWTGPKHVQPGPARGTVSCSGAGRASRTMTVIGQVLPPKIDIVQTGFSIRPYPYGGTSVSWGAILANRSKTQDALDVEVLCNMVMADNRLI